MKIQSKAALAVLALALSCVPMVAQGDPSDSPADQPGPPDGFAPPPPGGPAMGRDGGREWGRTRRGFGPGGRMDGRGFGGGGRDAGLERLLSNPDVRQQVGVTDAQVATIRQQESDFRKSEIRNRADLEVKRLELRDLLSADKPDRGAIDGKLQEISAAQLVIAKASVDHMLTMRDALTPAQRDKLRQLIRSRRGGPGPGAGPGPQASRRRGQRGAGAGGNAPAPPPGAPPQQPAQPTQ